MPERLDALRRIQRAERVPFGQEVSQGRQRGLSGVLRQLEYFHGYAQGGSEERQPFAGRALSCLPSADSLPSDRITNHPCCPADLMR